MGSNFGKRSQTRVFFFVLRGATWRNTPSLGDNSTKTEVFPSRSPTILCTCRPGYHRNSLGAPCLSGNGLGQGTAEPAAAWLGSREEAEGYVCSWQARRCPLTALSFFPLRAHSSLSPPTAPSTFRGGPGNSCARAGLLMPQECGEVCATFQKAKIGASL